jgi:hypothetical protein
MCDPLASLMMFPEEILSCTELLPFIDSHDAPAQPVNAGRSVPFKGPITLLDIYFGCNNE